jgi:PAS domain S-box-containing protein
MKEPSEEIPDWEAQRNQIIGLGETSIRKSYYPELQQRIRELEKKNRELLEASARQTAVEEELRQQIDETGKKERELLVNEERLIMAQQIGHSGSWEYSFATNMIWGSAEALRIYGFPPAPGYYPLEEIEACVEDQNAVRQAFADTINGRREYDIEITLNPRDGSLRRVVHSIARLEKDAEGKPVRMIGVLQDITERKQAERSLRESEERYRSLVDITDTGYLVINNQGRIIDANEVYLRLLGRSSVADLIGRSVTEWTAPYDLERNAREVEKCLTTGHVRGLEIDYIKPDGTVQPIEINATVFHTREGDVILTLCRDISERKRTHVALQQARSKLNLLNAITFQDLQTATFSLSAYQELIRNVIVEAKARSYLEKQDVFLKKMVDTLEFAKNYQEMGMHPSRWQNVRQVFLYAISHLEFLHMKQNLQLDNLEIFADPLFEKALFNIMENVLSHGVYATEVNLRFEEKPDQLVLIIEDNGVGIPTEEKNMIFDRGYGKGTGLGLFLVREVFSITGMIIKETGIPGKGTRFEISVPKGMYRFTR